MRLKAFRIVESQAQVATLKLVNSHEELGVLESLLEASKPPYITESEPLHYLLKTPFRYPPLMHGSRFGQFTERSIFYASLQVETVLAECAYYRLLFCSGLSLPFPNDLISHHLSFAVRSSAKRALDLTHAQFDALQDALMDKTSYRQTQLLGKQLRDAGVELFLYFSARTLKRERNVAVLVPHVLENRVRNQKAWTALTNASGVTFTSVNAEKKHHYNMLQFMVDGILPAAAL